MSSQADEEYRAIVAIIDEKGTWRPGRNGRTKSFFGLHYEIDLEREFPILTTKDVNYKAAFQEMDWFLRGETNVKTLGNGIWNKWANSAGEIGPVYGAQWRRWGDFTTGMAYDQIKALVDDLATDPYSRRHIVSAWNVSEIEHMALPPCHVMFQCYVRDVGGSEYPRLDLHLFQRSCDVAVGLPFNMCGYAYLVHQLTRTVAMTYGIDYVPGRFIHSIGDAHIYEEHLPALREQVKRVPRYNYVFGAPLLLGDSVLPYDPHPAIKYEVKE